MFKSLTRRQIRALKFTFLGAVIAALSAGVFLRLRTGDSPLPNAAKNEIIEIREKMFLTQVNDVYLNPRDYLGKTLKLAGIFSRESDAPDAACFVFRQSPGCCGYDGIAGFVVSPKKSAAKDASRFPHDNDWVECQGILQYAETDGERRLVISAAELSVLPIRGQEFVRQ